MKEQLLSLIEQGFPTMEEPMPRGDMPGDKIFYSGDSFDKAQTLYKELISRVDFETEDKIIISVSGGSGSGKTTLASILAFYFEKAGVGTYILSGDNYPHRIPEYNDAERVQIYRDAAQKALVEQGLYNEDVKAILEHIYQVFNDGSLDYLSQYDWYQTYHLAGKRALADYLGTDKELNIPAINRVLKEFKEGHDHIWLKRMGRTPDALWYDQVDFSNKKIMILEWTHGNHADLRGIDFRLFLNSTPAETMAYRKLRARDGHADSAFVTMVLGIEQEKLHQQSPMADLIFSKEGVVLDYDQYLSLIEGA
ncbi:zeta toxin family protein [Globicatella sulfidifaciens]|uniref:UDP-N-acetylglucosamine kinase n=1 Tax=Globicatella sulfidifaciens DSM 15739 TaxID=1121925 RepID=A0A1T4JL45_9LACT|nr:adenylyl-sulfate kinase [Globicatella sulfidifaciens]SJZ30905.1 Adenylylsulfate kinase [Globicatella sulfidifaciens DSM 15739]